MQNFTDDCYASSHQAAVDLQAYENNFAALKSCFSGLTAPSNIVAGMQWYDTTKKVTKRRDYGNAAWHGLMHGDTSQKIWVYRNAAMEGWAIDSVSCTDAVLALKGGTQYYNVNGGTNAGTWTQPGHVLSDVELPASFGPHSHGISSAVTSGTGQFAEGGGYLVAQINTDAAPVTITGGGQSHSHGNTYRPTAAVGTLQYLDLT